MKTKSWEAKLFIVEMIGTAALTLALGFLLLIPDVFIPLKTFANFASSLLFLSLLILWGPGLAYVIYKGMRDNWRSVEGLLKLEVYSILAFFYLLLFFIALNNISPSLKALTEKGTDLALSAFMIVTGTLLLIIFYRIIKNRHKVQEPKRTET